MQAPLCVEGWDEALHEIGRLSFSTVLSPQNAAALLKSVQDLPVLMVAGAEDALVSLKTAQAVASGFENSVSAAFPPPRTPARPPSDLRSRLRLSCCRGWWRSPGAATSPTRSAPRPSWGPSRHSSPGWSTQGRLMVFPRGSSSGYLPSPLGKSPNFGVQRRRRRRRRQAWSSPSFCTTLVPSPALPCLAFPPSLLPPAPL